MDIPTWAKVERPLTIWYEGNLLNRYYARYSTAEFVEAKTQEPINILDGRVLIARWISEDRYRDGIVNRFYDLAFVDRNNRASVISLRGHGADVVSEKLLAWSQQAVLTAMGFRLHFQVVPGRHWPVVSLAYRPVTEDEARVSATFLESPEWQTNAWLGV